jgi:hypothetical protein
MNPMVSSDSNKRSKMDSIEGIRNFDWHVPLILSQSMISINSERSTESMMTHEFSLSSVAINSFDYHYWIEVGLRTKTHSLLYSILNLPSNEKNASIQLLRQTKSSTTFKTTPH